MKIKMINVADQVLQQLKEIDDSGNLTYPHIEADNILMEFVRLEFPEIAEAYDEIGKWYE